MPDLARCKDGYFQSGREKALVLRDWERFLPVLKENDPLEHIYQRFTDRLYKHLTLHCSYIAHYDRNGFIGTYFTDPEDTPKFLQQFDKDKDHASYEYGMTYWLTGDSEDINEAMCDVFEGQKRDIYETLTKRTLRKKQEQIVKLRQELDALENELGGVR
jgi:hypothetical protein